MFRFIDHLLALSLRASALGRRNNRDHNQAQVRNDLKLCGIVDRKKKNEKCVHAAAPVRCDERRGVGCKEEKMDAAAVAAGGLVSSSSL